MLEEEGESVLLIYEVDYLNGFKVTEYLKNGRRKINENLVTKILYKECGLILSCYRSYLELFDGIDFDSKMKWHSGQEGKVKASRATVDCFDHSSKLSIIVLGGISGDLFIIDSQTFALKEKKDSVHQTEI